MKEIQLREIVIEQDERSQKVKLWKRKYVSKKEYAKVTKHFSRGCQNIRTTTLALPTLGCKERKCVQSLDADIHKKFTLVQLCWP